MSLLNEIASSTSTAIETLDRLADSPIGVGVLDALAEAVDEDYVRWEHAPGSRPHLVEHAHRALANLRTVEVGDRLRALDAEHNAQLAEVAERLRDAGLLRVVRLAVVLLDFAKGGSVRRRQAWSNDGADLTVHNEAAATILAQQNVLDAIDLPDLHRELLLQVVRNHGLAGQHARGETPIVAFEHWVCWVRRHAEELDPRLSTDVLHLVDVLDTEAVRPGLVDARLFGDLRKMRELWLAVVGDPTLLEDQEPLHDRFVRLRRQALEAGEPRSRIEAALREIAAHRPWVDRLLPNAQLWYFEPATHAMSSDTALRLLLLGLGLADQDDGVDCSKPFHLSFQPLVDSLGAPTARASYRVRLVEALLSGCDIAQLVHGEFSKVLVGFTPRIGGTTAVALELRMSEEAEALVTLLALYEKRSSVAFHQILKLLCDAYGLRKDEFDRLANEAQYLATMNAARTDKERMLDFVRPGTIVEVGPGGGVVLDLLEARYPDSEIIGIDVSEAVVEELERRRTLEGRAWHIIAGDAFELGALVDGVDTVIFCSLLHEIYSYVERDGRKFTFTAVRELLRAAYDALNPGGRIVIRDGVKPPPGRRVIEFIDPDGPDFLRRFQGDFEGREVGVDWLDDNRAALSTADAMEFLYCYTWGASSYPYEVRELYGIMERDEYERTVLEWLPGALAVDIPDDLRSYLQPGYVDGLSPKIVLTDDDEAPVELPDSNAIWVFERT